jgi:hypothetical protein
MKATIGLLALAPFLAAAAPTSQLAERVSSFTLRARCTALALDGLPVQAGAGLSFWLGGAPATYCPTAITACPPGNVTAFFNPANLVGVASVESIDLLKAID